jgi:cytochrome c2
MKSSRRAGSLELLIGPQIVDPAAKIPGTKMMFSDKNEKEIADLWAYLEQSDRMERRSRR